MTDPVPFQVNRISQIMQGAFPTGRSRRRPVGPETVYWFPVSS